MRQLEKQRKEFFLFSFYNVIFDVAPSNRHAWMVHHFHKLCVEQTLQNVVSYFFLMWQEPGLCISTLHFSSRSCNGNRQLPKDGGLVNNITNVRQCIVCCDW